MNAVTVTDRVVAEERRPIVIGTSEFWYSPYSAVGFILYLLILAQAISFLIPPFQSPDEAEHIKRAYLLSKVRFFWAVRAAPQVAT